VIEWTVFKVKSNLFRRAPSNKADAIDDISSVSSAINPNYFLFFFEDDLICKSLFLRSLNFCEYLVAFTVKMQLGDMSVLFSPNHFSDFKPQADLLEGLLRLAFC
jgi:hypothetical protein